MIRVWRATVARRSRVYRALPSSSPSSSSKKLRSEAFLHFVSPPVAAGGGGGGTLLWHLHPHPFLAASFISLRDFGTPQKSQSDDNGQSQGTAELGSVVTPDTEGVDNCWTHEVSDDCGEEVVGSNPAEDEEVVVDSDPEEEDDPNDAESSQDSPNDPNDAESSQDFPIDMSNVPDDLKEMLEDGYEIESAEEDLSTEGVVELLTIEEVKQVLEEVRARDVQVFPVHDRCEWTDLMVVATGISDRHVRGIAEALVYKIKKKRHVESPLYPTIEGQVGGKWLVVDCGNIVIHVLNEESRAYYRLEELWTGDVRPSTTDEDLEKMLNQAGLKEIVP